MVTDNRLELIRSRLTASLQPTLLEILDESRQHVGHAGALSGGGHYAIQIASPLFAGKKLVECHRMVYAALGDAVGKEIHAIRIDIKTG